MLRVKDLELEKIDYSGDWQKIEKRNWDKVDELDKKAKADGKIVGRYIKEGVADGYAIYLIIHASKDKVIIEHIGEICDDYVHSYFGKGREIDRDYAEQKLEWRDNMDRLFSKRKEK